MPVPKPLTLLPKGRSEIRALVERNGLHEAIAHLHPDDVPIAEEIHEELTSQTDQDTTGPDLKKDPLAYAYTHSGFCVTCLPHSAFERRLEKSLQHDERQLEMTLPAPPGQKARIIRDKTELLQVKWSIDTGRARLTVQPVPHPVTDAHYGVPHGPLARLVMLNLQTEAMRTQNPEINLGRSLTDFTKRCGAADSSTSRKTVANQFNRLAACQFTLVWGEAVSEIDLAPRNALTGPLSASGFERIPFIQGASYMQSGKQAWLDTVRLGKEFFEALIEHAVPLKEEALIKIKDSSLAIDIYLWLAYRLHRLKKNTSVSWEAIARQFGHENSQWFRQEFRDRLREVRTIYPEARVEMNADMGLMLRQSPSPVPRSTQILVLKPESVSLRTPDSSSSPATALQVAGDPKKFGRLFP